MAMYHSWDSQNAWLRQIHTYNYLYLSPKIGESQGFADGDWVWVESPHGKVRCMARFSESVEPGTVWTWNAIGKASGAWGLTPKANESQQGFLLNHVIAEELPPHEAGSICRIPTRSPVRPRGSMFASRSTRPTTASRRSASRSSSRSIACRASRASVDAGRRTSRASSVARRGSKTGTRDAEHAE
jgi:anaerobic selenocysteine-containing dehydrogenase